jgi:exodeoxyribonuclease-5
MVTYSCEKSHVHTVAAALPRVADATDNSQTQAIFVAEADRIAKAERKIRWHRPSRGEAEKPEVPSPPPIFTEPEAVDEATELEPLEVAGGATRGTVLHKLMEEVLTGETSDDVNDFHMENTCYHA